MRVGREIERQIELQIAAVLIQALQQLISYSKLSPPKVIQPNPGKRPKSDFKGAAPVDSVQERILLPPGGQLTFRLAQILVAAREPERLRQNHQVLVPVQLPDDLVIPGALEIQIRNPGGIGETGGLVVNRVAAPFDLVAKVQHQP